MKRLLEWIKSQLFEYEKLPTPNARCAYIPTDESPWGVIVWQGGKWAFHSTRSTRNMARLHAGSICRAGFPAKVVRLIVPTR